MNRKGKNNGNYKHGLGNRKNRLYRIWSHIKERCYNKNHKNYKIYGKKGIIVCHEWRNNFESFYNWSINNGYQDNLEIDRIKSDGNYEPSNCRWVSDLEQANNTSRNVKLTFNNKTQSMAQWAKELNINYSMLRTRIQNGWTIEDALTKPSHQNLFSKEILKQELQILSIKEIAHKYKCTLANVRYNIKKFKLNNKNEQI